MKNTNSHLYEYRKFCERKPKLSYQNGADFDAWRQAARAKLTELLGLPLETCEPCLEIEYARQKDGFTEYRFTVQTEPEYYVPCHLLVPAHVAAPVPVTLCLSGHGAGMHIVLGEAKNENDRATIDSWPHRAMALRAIRDGRAALVIEARNFGESSLEGYGCTCTEAAKIALLNGRTVLGERVWDAMRILDAVAEQFDCLDMTDLACTGNSGGGTVTYYLACLDDRIAVAAPSCSVCSYEASIAAMPHCLCNHVPGIRQWFEMGDLAGLIAPRLLVVAAGLKDDIFPIEGTKANFENIRRLYAAAGAPDHCALVIGEGGHLNYADLIWDKVREMKKA